MEKYLLGIDIGTSACKVAAFRINGEVAATASEAYPVYHPREGWAEQDPVDWWNAVCKAVEQVITSGGIRPREIVGIGVDGQSWSAIAIDEKGQVLTNTPIWMDTRAQSICDRLNREVGAGEIFENAGNSLQPSYSTAKILWYQENLPDVYQKIDKILQSNSFIVYKLTGQKTIDKSQAYGLHCFDMRHGIWNEEMGKKLGIPRYLLPEIAECSEVVGEVSSQAAKETGLEAGTPVVAGGLDAACGTLGAGVVYPGETQEQGGQAGGMSICLSEYKANPRLILSYHVVPGKWLLQGGTMGGGGAMRWFEHEFSGVIEEVGENVKNLQPGDYIAGVPLIPCMKCVDCLKGNYALCKHYSFIGSREFGSFAEYVVIPEKNAVKYEQGITFEQGAFLSRRQSPSTG